MTVALMSMSSLSEDDRRLLQALETKIGSYKSINRLLKAYYEGNLWLNKIGFSVPPKMQNFQTIMGWPAIVVDVIEERLKWKGWYDLTSDRPQIQNSGSIDPEAPPALSRGGKGDQEFFDGVFLDNNLEAEAPMVHLDALIYGCGFTAVGTRDPNDLETTPLITTESTELTTGIYDVQRRRLSSGVVFRTDDEGNIVKAALMKLNETLYLKRLNVEGSWIVEDRDPHNLGRLPLVPFINRPMASRRTGRSEITRPIRGYTDIGIRTLLGMETNREFFSAPQRYILGATEDDFKDEVGNKIPGWQAVIGRMWGIGRNEDGELPEVGQWDPSPSRPYLEQIQGLAQLVAADGAVPQTYLGFMSDNPASADSIRALESRLIKRSERRITSFGWSWGEVGRLAWMIANNSSRAPRLDTDWGNPATPTQQADADATMKLVSAGILPPTSVITRNRIGLSKTEQKILTREIREFEAKQRTEEARKASASLQNQLALQQGAQGGPGGVPTKAGGARSNSSGNNSKSGGASPRPSGGRVPGTRDYPR